jgi:hypothetical protein
MKQYMSQTALGILFGINQPKANVFIHYFMPILSAALNKSGYSPCRDMKDIKLLKEEEKSVYCHDGTERQVARPKNSIMQKENYSGKKKTHTVKNCVIVNAECAVIFLTLTAGGRKHDKKLADEAEYILPKGSVLLQDAGFQGFSVENVSTIGPVKKQKEKELTCDEKERNRDISKTRIRIEHVISSIKRYRIVKDKFRNWVRGFADTVMEIACALHNFRLRFRPWQKIKADHL